MGKLKNLTVNLTSAVTKAMNRFECEIQDILGVDESVSYKYIPVSDYAVAQGAQYDFPNTKQCNIKGYYLTEENLLPNYNPPKRSSQLEVPVLYDKFVGLRLTISDFYRNIFKIKDGVITYKNKVVAYPQDRVDEKLNQHLSELYLRNNSQSIDDKLCKINTDGYSTYTSVDDRRNIKNQYYEYKSKVYCARIDNDKIEWYGVAPIQAEYVNGKIRSKNVMLVTNMYDQQRVLRVLIDSTKLDLHPSGYVLGSCQKYLDRTLQ